MKKHIKLILRTLISNNACVEAARTREKKYNIIAVIFAIFALFFAALPTCVTGFQQKGGNWIRGQVNYSYEVAMRDFGETTTSKGVSFELKNHKLTAKGWENMDLYPDQDELRCFISKQPSVEGEDHKIMEIYYCPETYEDFSLFVEEIAKNINPFKVHKTTKNEDEKVKTSWLEKTGTGDDGTLTTRTTSFIVFGAKQVQGALCPPGISSIASSVYGDYANTPDHDDLIHEVLAVAGATDQERMEANRTFFDQAFVNTRNANTWRSTGIILGVDAGVILLMGFMVWVLTRGKNNPFRIYSFWDGQKIAYYASLTPGIISLFGFLMSNMAMMLFILGVGVRVMWLSMRTLRYQAPAK